MGVGGKKTITVMAMEEGVIQLQAANVRPWMFKGFEESFGTVPKGMKLDTKITIEAADGESPSVGTKFISPVAEEEEAFTLGAFQIRNNN